MKDLLRHERLVACCRLNYYSYNLQGRNALAPYTESVCF